MRSLQSVQKFSKDNAVFLFPLGKSSTLRLRLYRLNNFQRPCLCLRNWWIDRKSLKLIAHSKRNWTANGLNSRTNWNVASSTSIKMYMQIECKIAAVNCFILIYSGVLKIKQNKNWRKRKKRTIGRVVQLCCDAFLFLEFHQLENLVNLLYLLICLWFKHFA